MTITHIEESTMESIATKASIENRIERGAGYSILRFNDYQPSKSIWPIVLKEFGKIFKLEKPTKDCMKNIHQDLERGDLFNTLDTSTRTLTEEDSQQLLKTQWIHELTSELGLGVVDSYDFGYPSFTWRITRPNQKQDFRSLHRDVWFRLNTGGPEIFDDSRSSNLQRLSAWISLNTVKHESGLLIVPNSQNSYEDNHKSTLENGIRKPSIQKDSLNEVKAVYADTPEGSIAIWGQNFLHGGAPNISNECRISLEFTLCSIQQSYYRAYESILDH